MIIFGYTPNDLLEKVKQNKLKIASYAIAFILGAIIF
jgi:hypothetical protein